MNVIIEGIRKIVVLVLLAELVLQLQSGKKYEPYMKLLVGIMVVYSLVSVIFGAFGGLENALAPMQEMQWSGEWLWEIEVRAEEMTEKYIEEYAKETASKGTENDENQDAEKMTGKNSEIQVDEVQIPSIKIALE